MTPAQCNAMCQGYAYYGVESSSQCFCAKTDWKARYQKTKNEACNKPCVGDMSVMCGGIWHNSVYKTAPTQGVAVAPQCRNQMNFWKRARAAQAARKKQQQALLHKKPVGPGTYVGCFQDHPGPPKMRVLPIQARIGPHMTTALCSKLCAKYEFYGLRNHNECRCAGVDWLPKYGIRPDVLCNAPCSGNPTMVCGGLWQASVFRQPHDKIAMGKKTVCPAGTFIYHRGSHCCKVNRDKEGRPLTYTSPDCFGNEYVPCPVGAFADACGVSAVPCPDQAVKASCPVCTQAACPTVTCKEAACPACPAAASCPQVPPSKPVKTVQITEHAQSDHSKKAAITATPCADVHVVSDGKTAHVMMTVVVGAGMFGAGMLASWCLHRNQVVKPEQVHERERLNGNEF